MTDCKNCNYTDEYCASGDCTAQNDLTEQMHKGELPYAEYYIKLAGGEYTNDVWDIGGWQSFNKEGDVVVEVLAPVPSYKEYERILVENDSLKQIRDELDCDVTQLREDKTKLEEESNKLWQANKEVANRNIDLIIKLNTLKELLKECKMPLEVYNEMFGNKEELLTKIDEVLNA